MVFISQDVRPYIYREYWEYQGVDVLFKRVSEAGIKEYSGDPVEWVVWPDGRITEGWLTLNQEKYYRQILSKGIV
jgi:hypothetical protein